MGRNVCRLNYLGSIVLLSAGLAPISGAVGADQARRRPVTFESAARDTVEWHPSITAASGTLNANQEEIAAARAGYSPQISAGVGTSYDSRLSGGWRPRPQVSASQMLYDFGKVASAVDAARAGTRAGHAQLLLVVDDMVRETSFAVVEAQRAAALRDVAARQHERVGEINRLVRERFERGAATRSDALQAQARVEGARALLAQIEASQRRWISNLGYLVGRAVTADDVTADVPEWLGNACARADTSEPADVPAVMLAEARRDEATADLRRSRADRLPTVSLGGNATTDVTGPFSDRSIYNVGVNVSSNVFNGGALSARVRGASYALSAAEASIAAARNDIAQGLAEARQQIDGLKQLRAMLFARQENMVETGKLYRLQYLEMGTRTLVDLLNAEQELHQARLDAANTTHDLRRLDIDCLYFSGRLRDVFGLTGTSIRGVTI